MPPLNASSMPVADRVSLAKQRTRMVVDHLRASIEMQEANAIVVYSPILAEQIPESHAAHAFNQFQRSMHFFEIVRLCALWDGADRDKENIPTIIALIDDADVRAVLNQETRASYGAMPPHHADPSWCHDTRKKIEQGLCELHEERRHKYAAKINSRLDDAIAKAKSVIDSPRLKSVLNIRHKHVAHSLAETNFEQRGSVHPMKYGDERWLFEETLEIVDGLHIGINGAAFMWDDARRIARRNAEALWKSCTFTVRD